MIKALLQFILIFLLLCLLLTFESVVGLPIVFLAVLGLLSGLFPNLLWWPFLLLMALSWVMGAAFQIPLAAAFVILISLVQFNIKGKAIVENKIKRVAVGSAAGSALVLLFSDLALAELSLLTLLLQGSMVFLLGWRLLGLPKGIDKSLTKRLGRG